MKDLKIILVILLAVIGLSSCYQEPIHDLTPEEEEEVNEYGCVAGIITGLQVDSYNPQTDSLHAEFGIRLDDSHELSCEDVYVSLVIYIQGGNNLMNFTYSSGWTQTIQGDPLHGQGSIVLQNHVSDPVDIDFVLDHAQGDQIYVQFYVDEFYKSDMTFDGH